MAFSRGRPSPSPWPLLFLLLLLTSSPLPLPARPLLLHPSINVAVVFSGSSYQTEVRGRLSGENFVDLPVVVSPVTVLVNDTNPRDLLTHLCDTMATEKLHGVVFEDDVGSGAGAQVAEVAQILDFLSTQTALPIVGISGGSAIVIPYKETWAPTLITIHPPDLKHSHFLLFRLSALSVARRPPQLKMFSSSL
ncbi:Glutamate receptor ionotropic, NMDA 2A [Takifugu flavidus]|uniref:Glutamate receptor ionotropic, NMDA 2A n=1 Tax=Takifugu flavidus TaxID=433684 RepID=A0A5C6PT94_9TELE|nr:Glutamate receptor ionotropic, NMDA 2A [Takifugu flavidus]